MAIKSIYFSILFVSVFLVQIFEAYSINPDEVIVLANQRYAESVEIARYYMDRRNIKKDHLVLTNVSVAEEMSRAEYERKIIPVVLRRIKKLERNGKLIYCVVVIHGMPIKVLAPLMSRQDEEALIDLKHQRTVVLNSSLSKEQIESELSLLDKQIASLRKENTKAAFDSELSLIKIHPYELAGWLENPFFLGFQQKTGNIKKSQVLMVSRIDGPDSKTAYRIIDDTLAAESRGLSGSACFDARWPEPDYETALDGYRLYDQSLHRAARFVSARLEVKLDQSATLFGAGACENTALYGGWYSLAEYIDSFTWVQGSIGYHIASAECTTLRKQTSRVWCKRMLEEGIAATLGPVYEPYVQGFPLPEIFFAQISDGYMNLGESYLVSLPYLSWQMMLIGDPLYQPFKPLEQ